MHTNRLLPYLAVAAVVAAVLIAVGAPLASLLPFALLLVCPLMMVLMMRRMSGSHGADHTGRAPNYFTLKKSGRTKAGSSES